MARFIAIAALLCLILFTQTLRANAEERELLIGLIPEQNIFKQIERYKPLAGYLSARTGITVRLTILSRYGDIIDRFVQRGLDGAFFGDLTGALAIEKLDIEPLVRPVNLDGSTYSYGYIIVRKDSGIRTVADMKGTVLAFVDRATVTGYLFPLSYFRSHGVKNLNDFFSEYYFTGSHDSSVYAVLDGRADIGCIKNTIYNNLVSRDPTIKSELRIIAKSPLMPESTLCLRKDLPEDMKKMIKEVLLTMDRNEEGRKILAKLRAKRFIEASVEDFKPVYEMLKTLGEDIETYQYRVR
ncbi:MAG: phosphate/phosphite/phosphonate ABC transporter substrate-binding protein [Nitrospirota bacterium]|nr:phosphate/phosphite/phosphonate ABC transporter substrate-binding protein [Nitrospirota bacterium]